eukprot:jgi/Hompol1/4867/HPOL_003957-RA
MSDSKGGSSSTVNEDPIDAADEVEIEETGQQGQANKDMRSVTRSGDDSAGTVNQTKLEKALFQLVDVRQAISQAKAAKDAEAIAEQKKMQLNKADVEFVMREMDLSKIAAEKALRDAGGDATAALRHLIHV